MWSEGKIRCFLSCSSSISAAGHFNGPTVAVCAHPLTCTHTLNGNVLLWKTAIHQEGRDKVPPRRGRLLLIRPPLPFGFTVAPKGQAETFVFHYEVGTETERVSAGKGRCRRREWNKWGGECATNEKRGGDEQGRRKHEARESNLIKKKSNHQENGAG